MRSPISSQCAIIAELHGLERVEVDGAFSSAAARSGTATMVTSSTASRPLKPVRSRGVADVVVRVRGCRSTAVPAPAPGAASWMVPFVTGLTQCPACGVSSRLMIFESALTLVATLLLPRLVVTLS